MMFQLVTAWYGLKARVLGREDPSTRCIITLFLFGLAFALLAIILVVLTIILCLARGLL